MFTGGTPVEHTKVPSLASARGVFGTVNFREKAAHVDKTRASPFLPTIEQSKIVPLAEFLLTYLAAYRFARAWRTASTDVIPWPFQPFP
jgi:hypothetical protein